MSGSYDEIITTLPGDWPDDILSSIQEDVLKSESTIVVLDDDPTGTQTVADVPILTGWTVEKLAEEFQRKTPLVFVLTNSRSLSPHKAEILACEIGENIKKASEITGRDFLIISRSDSTLRGHFPGEVDAIKDAIGRVDAIPVIIPFFLEGGRYTIHDIHYVREGDRMIPAAETPFARDAVFGYHSSNIREWVEEKTSGRIPAEQVLSITIDDIRNGGPDVVLEKLTSETIPPAAVVVNAASYRDIEVVTRALMDAEKTDRTFIYRTAASFVRVRAGLSARPLLTKADISLRNGHGGLIVVGSYVPKSGEQLEHLLEHGTVRHVELNVNHLLDSTGGSEIARVIAVALRELAGGRDVVVYTTRKLFTGSDAKSSLAIGEQISQALVDVVREVAAWARYILAKGGITSSDIATRALGVKRAIVLGQILPGVPVWQLGEECKTPGIPYIVFPGNVGGEDAVTTVVNELART